MIKSIETNYNGFRFRSRLEARCAVFLEAAKIPYSYEPEGLAFEDGTTYLPDFYLQNQDTFLECKGVMGDKDMHKIEQLAKETRKEIVVLNPDMSIDMAIYADNLHDIFPWEEEKPGAFLTPAGLGECFKCHKKFFYELAGGWECRCCGYYDGDGTAIWLYSSENEDYEPIKKAKRARFEYGEDGT